MRHDDSTCQRQINNKYIVKEKNRSWTITLSDINLSPWCFCKRKVLMRFIQTSKTCKLCKMANFSLAVTLSLKRRTSTSTPSWPEHTWGQSEKWVVFVVCQFLSLQLKVQICYDMFLKLFIKLTVHFLRCSKLTRLWLTLNIKNTEHCSLIC